MSNSTEISNKLMPTAFGGRIRELRQKKRTTLQELADQAGISVGFLSLVERDKATPSLGTLASIAAALDVDVDLFISAPKPSESVTRAGERQPFSLHDTPLRYEQITKELSGGILTSLIIHVPKGYASEEISHVGEELIMVLDGNIKQTLGQATFSLKPGDSMHFMGDTPHSFANIGDSDARLLWTGTSPHLSNLRKTLAKS